MNADHTIRIYYLPTPSTANAAVSTPAEVVEFRSPQEWKQKPGVWNGRVSLARRIDGDRLLGVATVAGISAAGWVGIAALLIHFMR